MTNLVSRALARLYEHEYGLTVAEWRLIAILARFGPLSANGVCERTGMDKVRVSRAVARASARKLVSRDVDAEDRRRLVLALTPRAAPSMTASCRWPWSARLNWSRCWTRGNWRS